jgi:hypothetical protein
MELLPGDFAFTRTIAAKGVTDMADDGLFTTFNQMLLRYASERADAVSRTTDYRTFRDKADIRLSQAETADKHIVEEDNRLVEMITEVRTYYDALPLDERTQAVADELANLSIQRHGAHERRMRAHENLRHERRLLEEATLDLAASEQTEKALAQRIVETNAQIEKLRHS